ncbi:MAG: AMP-binding protein [Chloroflexi bacterium]|nr:AMP-binding protein [Chloroflexota bacterium]
MLLSEVISHLYDNSPAFRARLGAADLTPADLQTEDDLASLPILRKDDLIELQRQNPPFGGLLAVPLSELRAVYQSPGPINEPSPKRPDAGGWAVALQAAGFTAGEVVLNALGYHMTPAGASLEDSLTHIGCVVIPGGIGQFEQQIGAMAMFGATGFVGLPSYLKVLLDKAAEMGQPLQLDKALVLAEPLPPSLRHELHERGVRVFQAYGTAECGNLGYECETLQGWHIPDGRIVQVCDINTGEPLPAGEMGEVVVTLLNHAYAATVRFGVGDLSTLIDEPCGCGRSGLRLAGWQGRVGAATKVRGMFLHPSQLAGLMARFPEVASYQAVITRTDHKDELALEVVVAEGHTADGLVERLESAARQAIKFRLEARLVASLPPSSPIRDERQWE